MALPFSFTPLKDLKPYKNTWRIQGDKIGATVRKDHINKFEADLVPGTWKIISTFGLNLCTAYLRPSLIKYKISTRYDTTISPSGNVSDNHYLSFTSFDSILAGNLDKNLMLDVICQVVSSVGIKEITSRNNITRKKIKFEIRDTEDNRLSCTLWETYAEALDRAINESSDCMVMCFLRFVKQNSFKEKRYIENAFNSSILMINPQLPEMEAFQNILLADQLALTITNSGGKRVYNTSGSKSGLEFPLQMIADVLAETEVGKCRIACSISGIDTDWGWFYISCCKCNKKVDKEDPTVKLEDVKKPSKPRWRCETCNEWATLIEPKYKLHVHVWDKSGVTKVFFFDTWASKIVGVSAAEILNGSFEEIMDPNLIADQIKAVCGKTFQFLICIAGDNLSGARDSYKVANVWEGNKFMEIGNEESENTIDRISLTNSKQRKTESIHPTIDQSSTSKKQCSNHSTDFTEDKGDYPTKDLNEVISCEDVDHGKA
ncbi:PREDICTED: replication protein A 70 kDa DNA-binding subunit B-like [Camelina sativa]|uniref:Replication protein A 70 kDa DNA-binding subunit B-like n=1 Tax=Camelina sativa TaxID=90675 RepID=A0ABM0SKZ5_CAMSA|nr:PREDICTED: replication protein A 70 kDa DNA-binding subunit B-like [Camelina sativa]